MCAREAEVNQQLTAAYEQQDGALQAKLEEARGLMKQSLTRVAEQVSTELRAGFDRERQGLRASCLFVCFVLFVLFCFVRSDLYNSSFGKKESAEGRTCVRDL